MNVDFHIDVGYQIYRHGAIDLTQHTNRAFDLPSIREGKLDEAVCVVYLPDRVYANTSKRVVRQLLMHQISEIHEFAKHCWQEENYKLHLGLEGARHIQDVDDISMFEGVGIRYLTLVHNTNNHLVDSCTDNVDKVLTEFGEQVIRRCEELGILIDVSHMHQESLTRVINCTSLPIIASHSGCYTLCKHPRNLQDYQLRLIASTGGVVGIPFVENFVGQHIVSEHIDWAVQTIGIDHVGIGSDLDGAQCVIDSVRDWEFWKESLYKIGYTVDNINKISGGNWLRILN